MTDPIDDPSCDVAHGHAPPPGDAAHRPAPSPDDVAHGHAPPPGDAAHRPAPSPDDVAHGHAPPPGDAAHRPAPSPDDVAHGYAPSPDMGRTLVAVFASPVAEYLLRYAGDAGFRPVLVEPDPQRAAAAGGLGVTVVSSADGYLDDTSDVVVTDHHRPELGIVLRDALASKARWVGIMGNPRHPAPHIPALTELGVPEAEIGRVHRPIGLNIGSRTPAEIAVATLAGLIADRNGRPGGFTF